MVFKYCMEQILIEEYKVKAIVAIIPISEDGQSEKLWKKLITLG